MTSALLSQMVRKLCLGSAQFGLRYGLGAAAVGLSRDTVNGILEAAASRGIWQLDTARSYGSAEERLGQWLARQPDPERFAITTKFPPIAIGASGSDSVIKAVEDSLAALGRHRVNGLLAHRVADLFRPGVLDVIKRLHDKGIVDRFGASVYGCDEARRAFSLDGIGLVQIPFNLANREFLEEGLFDIAARKDIRIQARSLFMQGLLLMNEGNIPPHLSAAAPAIGGLQALAHASQVSLLQIAMASTLCVSGISEVVVGVDSQDQLDEVINAAQTPVPSAVIEEAIALARRIPPHLVHVNLWPKP